MPAITLPTATSPAHGATIPVAPRNPAQPSDKPMSNAQPTDSNQGYISVRDYNFWYGTHQTLFDITAERTRLRTLPDSDVRVGQDR